MDNKTIDLNININVSTQGNHADKKEMLDIEQGSKIKTGLSVAQLAYFFKMLSAMGIIKTNSISDLIRCVIKNISTSKTEDISFDSFKTKYYNPEQSTKQAVYEAVIKQLDYLKKDIGG